MKNLSLKLICAVSVSPLLSMAAIIWAPDTASPSGHFGTDMPDNSVINYGVFTDDTGSSYNYEVVFNDMQQFLRNADGTANVASTVLTDVGSNRNQFEVVGGVADLNTFFNANNSHDSNIAKPPYANGPGTFAEISINFYTLGTYITGAAQTGLPAGVSALQLGSGTAASVNFGITSPNHTTFTRLNNIEEFGVDWGSTGSVSLSDPFNQIDTTTVDGAPSFSSDYDFIFAVEAAGFGNDLDGDGRLAPAEAQYNVILPSSSSFTFLRSDSDGSRATGTNSAIGFTSNAPIPEPSSSALLSLGVMAFTLRRKRK